MKKLWLVLLVILIGCVGQQIPQDTPVTPEQCFEGKLNPHRIVEWDVKQPSPGVNLFIFTNPDKKALPDIVLATVQSAYRMIWRYCYLDGRKVMAYVFDPAKGCYVVEVLAPEMEIELHKALLKLRNGHEV